MSAGILILAYHKVGGPADLSLTRVSERQFRAQMALLKSEGFETWRLSDYLAWRRGAPDVPTRRNKTVVITFDDAFLSVYERARPILKQYGYVGNVFVISGYVGRRSGWDYPFSARERHCSWAELSALARDGWEIGSHSHSHAALTTLSDTRLARELRVSRRLIEDRLRAPVRVLSLPFGRGDLRVHRFAADAGYRAVCTLGGEAPLPNLPSGPIWLPRAGVYRCDSLARFRQLVRRPWMCQDRRQSLLSFCAGGTVVWQALRHWRKAMARRIYA